MNLLTVVSELQANRSTDNSYGFLYFTHCLEERSSYQKEKKEDVKKQVEWVFLSRFFFEATLFKPSNYFAFQNVSLRECGWQSQFKAI